MLESAKMKDYEGRIAEVIYNATNEGKEYVDVNAKQLHKEMSIKPTLPTCCMAMRKMMKVGDEFISSKESQDGNNSKLTVRYFLANREERELLNPPKPRGRKTGSKSKNHKEKIMENEIVNKQKVTVSQSVENFLAEAGITYVMDGHKIIADGAYGKWLIILDHTRRGRKVNFATKILELMGCYSESFEKYSFAMMSDLSSELEWKEISDSAKSRLNMSILKVTPKGKVKEI